MDLISRNRWIIEIIWWLLTLLLTGLILLKVYESVEGYPFYIYNAMFVIVFLTFTRYIFLLNQTPFIYNSKLKLFLFFLSIPLCFIIFEGFYSYQSSVDEYGAESYFIIRPGIDSGRSVRFIHTQMMFFGVASFIASVVMPVRMVVSIWKTKNRGTY